jgi:hypothetical protein
VREDYSPNGAAWDYFPHDGLFGGNSNWRGPIWFPVNCLLVKALQQSGEREGAGDQHAAAGAGV